jgi:hypothetical protein
MSGYISGLQAALRSVFGSVQTDSASNQATYTKVVNIGATEAYGISLFTSATGVGTFHLLDATASGQTLTPVWQTNTFPLALIDEFARPLQFRRGLLISYTATAATVLASNVLWAPGFR